MYFKDQALLIAAPLVPARPYRLPLPDSPAGSLAHSYNRVGGLLQQLSCVTAIDAAALLGVWHVTSAGRIFVPGQAALRFEVDQFFRHWGRANPAAFDAHFQFGGHAGLAGRASANHRMRETANAEWRAVHAGQPRERAAFALAQTLGGADVAAMASRLGGAQIPGFNHSDCGYGDAAAMHAAFNTDQRWQVLGLFDWAESNGWLDLVRAHQWKKFAQAIGGPGERMSPCLAEAWSQRDALLALPRD